VVLDAYNVALPRGDLLTDGSHYAAHYRRVLAQMLLGLACD